MKKVFLLLIITLSTVKGSFAQEEKSQYIRKGLIRSMATFAPGIMLKENVSTISIHGCLEYYVANNVSLRGDSYYDMMASNNKSEGQPFEFNHSTFSGASYHFKTKNNFDPYVAFEPGIAISKRADFSDDIFIAPVPDYYAIHPKTEVNPLFSSAFGFNYYFQRWFHLFMETRYIGGKHISTDGSPTLSLNELRFSFGLGFNLNLLKKKQVEG